MADGTGATGLVTPLARMWRTVYRKAAEVAEARTQELLKYHVYVYPHSAGGGGGGGGWVLLDELGPLAANTASPLAFAGVPQDCLHLWLHFSGRGLHTGLGTIGVQANADNAVAHYSWTTHYVQPTAVHTQSNAAADNSVIVADLVNAGEPAGALTTADVYLWGYAKSDARYKSVQATAQTDDLDGLGDDRPQLRQTVGVWRSGAPITAVRVAAFNGAQPFAAGTHVQLFGLRAG